MSEITVAARIKMARKMADFSTQAKLIACIPEWKPSRLGNYEAGISIPGPDDILKIAKATGSSPCWLMFGLGPIRANHRDLQAIRHQNLCNCFEPLNKQELLELAKALLLSEQTLMVHIENPFHPINDSMARLFEQHLNLGEQWMDEQHVENDPLCLAFPDDIRELMSLYSLSAKKNRRLILKVVKTMTNELDEMDK